MLSVLQIVCLITKGYCIEKSAKKNDKLILRHRCIALISSFSQHGDNIMQYEFR